MQECHNGLINKLHVHVHYYTKCDAYANVTWSAIKGGPIKDYKMSNVSNSNRVPCGCICRWLFSFIWAQPPHLPKRMVVKCYFGRVTQTTQMIIVYLHISQEEIKHRVDMEYRLFCRLMRVYKGLRQYFSEGVQNFVHWHFLKSNMAAATPRHLWNDSNSLSSRSFIWFYNGYLMMCYPYMHHHVQICCVMSETKSLIFE